MNQAQQTRRYSARSAVLLGFAGIVVLVGGLTVWSLTSEIAGAVIANGEVTVAAGNQSIEHLDGGAVAEVYVRNGDRVSLGDPLLRFAEASLRDELATLAMQDAQLVAQRNRLEAEHRGNDTIGWDDSLLMLAEENPAVDDLLTHEQALFDERLVNHRARIAVLRERVSQADSEVAGLAADDALAALDGRNRIAEMQAQILQLDATRSSEAEALLLAAVSEEHALQERIRRLAARIARATLHAPIEGTVFDLTVSGPGEVVRPGEPLLQIVPDASALIVRARISPNNIDQVHVGQDATVRFSAFPYRSSPERTGRVLGVSADVFTDSNVGASWYEADLAFDPLTDAESYGDALTLVPGMPAEVQISTGSRSVVSYLVKPVTDFFNRSLREE